MMAEGKKHKYSIRERPRGGGGGGRTKGASDRVTLAGPLHGALQGAPRRVLLNKQLQRRERLKH